jgi:hypothetical protein
LRAFSELLEDGSPQSIEQAKEIYEKLPEGPQRFSELRLLAFSWGQSDPESALEWSSNLDGFDKRIGTGSVLDSWARYDPDQQFHGPRKISRARTIPITRLSSVVCPKMI